MNQEFNSPTTRIASVVKWKHTSSICYNKCMICERCNTTHSGDYGSGRFCSRSCANSRVAHRDEINKKISTSLIVKKTSYWRKSREPWNKGLTTMTDDRVKTIGPTRGTKLSAETRCKISNGLKAYYLRTEEKRALFRTRKQQYRFECRFRFNVYEFPELFDLQLLAELGWYHPTLNPDGISRDHRLSISDGFALGVDPLLMSSPMNCKLVVHRENNKKNTKSTLTPAELSALVNKR